MAGASRGERPSEDVIEGITKEIDMPCTCDPGPEPTLGERVTLLENNYQELYACHQKVVTERDKLLKEKQVVENDTRRIDLSHEESGKVTDERLLELAREAGWSAVDPAMREKLLRYGRLVSREVNRGKRKKDNTLLNLPTQVSGT
jgi:hypothetical protein